MHSDLEAEGREVLVLQTGQELLFPFGSIGWGELHSPFYGCENPVSGLCAVLMQAGHIQFAPTERGKPKGKANFRPVCKGKFIR